MFCNNCGEKLVEGKKFCATCGEKVEQETKTKPINPANPVNPTNPTNPVNPRPRSYRRAEPLPPVQPTKKNPLKTIAYIFGGFFAFSVVLSMFSDSDTSTSYHSSSSSSSSNSVNGGNSVSQNNGKEETEEIVAPIPKTTEEIEGEYKSTCSPYDYQTIFRDSEKYKGELATFTGEATQVLVEDNIVNIRMSVTKSEIFGSDFYEDVIFVIYEMAEGESRILEKDIITVYGKLNGVLTYESVLGGNVTVPRVDVKYIDNITAGDEVYVPPVSTPEAPTQGDGSLQELDFYFDVIKDYANALIDEYSMEKLEAENLNYLTKYYSYGEIGCAMLDVDNNGVKELFIGEYDGYDQGLFLDLYTIENNKLVLVTRNAELYRHFLCEDYLFYYLQSGNHVDPTVEGTYQLMGSELVPIYGNPQKNSDSVQAAIDYVPLEQYLSRS